VDCTEPHFELRYGSAEDDFGANGFPQLRLDPRKLGSWSFHLLIVPAHRKNTKVTLRLPADMGIRLREALESRALGIMARRGLFRPDEVTAPVSREFPPSGY